MTKQRLGWVVAGLVLVAAAAFVYANFDSGALAALLGGGGTYMALTVPPQLPTRGDIDQRLHVFRFRFTVANVGRFAPGVKIGRFPARSWIHSIKWHKSVAFNSATTDTLQMGTTQTGVDILAATTITGTGYVDHTAAAGLGIAVTANEVDLWARYVQSGAAASTGDVTAIVVYSVDNDQ